MNSVKETSAGASPPQSPSPHGTASRPIVTLAERGKELWGSIPGVEEVASCDLFDPGLSVWLPWPGLFKEYGLLPAAFALMDNPLKASPSFPLELWKGPVPVSRSWSQTV